jgi:hypothetical protein
LELLRRYEDVIYVYIDKKCDLITFSSSEFLGAWGTFEHLSKNARIKGFLFTLRLRSEGYIVSCNLLRILCLYSLPTLFCRLLANQPPPCLGGVTLTSSKVKVPRVCLILEHILLKTSSSIISAHLVLKTWFCRGVLTYVNLASYLYNSIWL